MHQKTSYLHHFVFHIWSMKLEIVLNPLHYKSYWSVYKTNHFRLHHLGSIYRKGGSKLAKMGHVLLDFKETSHILLGGADKKNYEKI